MLKWGYRSPVVSASAAHAVSHNKLLHLNSKFCELGGDTELCVAHSPALLFGSAAQASIALLVMHT